MVPGTSAVTVKKKLVHTLRACYGRDNTDELLPRTFMLPQERSKWQEWVQTHPEQDTGFWLLKTKQHRAEGLSLVPTSEAHAASSQLAPQGHKWTMIQQYITNPLLLGGRKFHVRLHVLIPPGLDPFRVYMHKRGFAYFAGDDYETASNTSSGLALGSQELRTGLPAGHFTNHGTQSALPCVKELATLCQELGEDVWRMLWDSMTNSTARILAAALAHIDVASSRIGMPSRTAYELFGIDFLVDENMHVWVTEVNAGPSVRMDKGDPAAKVLRERVVMAVTRDMFDMMRLQDRKWDQSQEPVLDISEVEAELQLKGGWLPLMHLFPQNAASVTEPSGVTDIRWSEADLQLQAWIKSSPAYKQAIADWYP